MSEHFRAFSFVDRIVSDEPGTGIVGEYHIPDTLENFSLSLVAESIGQCAAMSSMASVDFCFRPVAGIAGEVRFCGRVNPGDTLQLHAELVKSDREAVGYHGKALVDGEPVVKLLNCLGPMVPIDDFDDAEAVRARYKLLQERGADPDAFTGVPVIDFEISRSVLGSELEGRFVIPVEAAFFGDHFARRPVFPGTLLMDLNLRFLSSLIDTLDGGPWGVEGMRDVKLRSFMPPGEELSLYGELENIEGDRATILVQSRRGKRLNSSARVQLSRTPK